MSADWHDSRDNLQSTYISLPIAGGYFDNHFIELPPWGTCSLLPLPHDFA